MKPEFPLCHIQILNNATDTASLIIMHDITFTTTASSAYHCHIEGTQLYRNFSQHG
jgi:hypothetical protein